MGRHEDVDGVLEALAGPLTWSDPDHAAGTYGGTPIGLEKWYSRGGGSMALGGVTFTWDLGGRPINLSVSLRESRGPGPIRIGEGGFAGTFAVKGWPADAVAAALDPSVQRLIADGFDGRYPSIETKHGQLRYARRMLLKSPDRLATPAELEPYLAATQFMGSRLVATFDSTMDELRRTQGEAAAQAWYDEQAGTKSRASAKRAGVRVLALIGAVVIGAAFTVAVVAGVF